MLIMLRNLIKSCLKLYIKLWIWILVEVFLLIKASLFPPDVKSNQDGHEGLEARSKALTQEPQLGAFNFWDVSTDWDFWAAVNSHNRRRHASLPTTLRR